ncbi:MAG: 30S ribosomal protein S19e [Methanocellales archaeon]|nr:30S ribosomal protein S19e [Methanocellales archaeon]
MTTIYDVPASALISKAAQQLKKEECITPPKWAVYVKTGVHKEMPPSSEDWWYVRCASILRRVYIDGPVGVSRLRSFYGGRESRGSQPERFSKGSGSIIREAVQQLEKAGYIRSMKGGRVISPQGQSFLDNIANELKKEFVKEISTLEKY